MYAYLELVIASDLAELAADALFECGAGGLEERGTRRTAKLVVYGADRAEIETIARDLPRALAQRGIEAKAYSLRVDVDETTDWERGYFAHLRAVEVAPGYWLKPTHDESELPSSARVIVYEPAVAFGDGSHPTTRLATCAVVDHCARRPGERIADFGTGTGVLALAALLAGAASAVGIDIDPRSIEAARRNAELNGLSSRAAFRVPDPSLGVPDSSFDWVIANVEEPALIAGAAQIAELASRDSGRDSVLAVTGFLEERVPRVVDAFEAQGFSLAKTNALEGWALIDFRAR